MDPTEVVGRWLREVVLGWHVAAEAREPALLWLRLDDRWTEVCTWGDGSLRLDSGRTPRSFDMAELGRFEILPAESTHPLHPLIGRRIDRIGRIVWRRTCVGLVLHAAGRSAVVANDADELFTSTDRLPADVSDAAIEG
jgi:hypothetical protein